MKQSFILNTIYFLLIFLFIYAGLNKLYEHVVFHAQLTTFPFLKYAEPALSWMLPILELAVAIFLVIPKLRLYGLYTSLILLVLFTVYLIVMITSGVNLPCSCGDVIAYLSWKQHIIFNLFFIIIAFVGLYCEKKSKSQSISNEKMYFSKYLFKSLLQ